MQELVTAQLRGSKLSEALRTTEAARRTAEEYARKLEVKFEKSGRGVALLKAARLNAELEAIQQEVQQTKHTVVSQVCLSDCIKHMQGA